MPRRLTVEFTPVPGDWGAQVGWLDARLYGAFPGLVINRMPVFQRSPGVFTYGSPLVPGDLPASRHSCITFVSDAHRRRFLVQLDSAFRTAYPELFATEEPPR
jgi:hypothetical protein